MILVTGGRTYENRDKVFRVLKEQYDNYKLLNGYDKTLKTSDFIIVQGGCETGVDKFVRDWCKVNVVMCITVEAPWMGLKRPWAGPLRNQWMVNLLDNTIVDGDVSRDHVIAFNGGKGTKSCINIAKKAGLTVEVID